MKKIVKVASGLVAVVAACLLAVPAQARTFVSVNVGGGYGGGYGYACAPRYAAPCYPAGYCYRAPVYYRPAFGCYFPRFHFSGFWR